ncbi:MAG: DegQ family serine endoprotease [Nitrospirae bacterium]|nr:MAG: DegQ family serine endoprotease [Nitrospirota bacterium]
MKRLLHRKLGIIVGLAILAAVAWAGESITSSHASGSTSPAVASQATPATQGLAPSFVEVAKAVTPAVVNITTSVGERGRDARGPRDRMRDPMEEFFGSPWGPRAPLDQPEHRHGGMGSGVIVSPDGYIITNNHVIDGARELTITLPDKREFKGKVIGTDPKTDLALIKVEAQGLPSVPWGDSSKLQVGEYVLAVGNPFGLNSTVTLGIVSALGRGRMGITQYEDFIQTDAAINPGNSGGALVNARGELVGINTAIFSQTGGYQGVGFAVPTSMAQPVSESLMKTGKVVRGYLGVGIQEVTQDLAKSFGLKQAQGALVSDVNEDSPAEQAGIKQGDVITGYQGSPVEDPVALQRKVTRTPVGTKATVKVARNGHEMDLAVMIGEQPDTVKIARAEQGSSEHPLAGVAVQELDRQTARDLGLTKKTQGVVVTDVEPDSLASQAGLAPGDVIREINKQPVQSVVLLLINRRGASLFLSVKV